MVCWEFGIFIAYDNANTYPNIYTSWFGVSIVVTNTDTDAEYKCHSVAYLIHISVSIFDPNCNGIFVFDAD